MPAGNVGNGGTREVGALWSRGRSKVQEIEKQASETAPGNDQRQQDRHENAVKQPAGVI
jgi:hypothetical protein